MSAATIEFLQRKVKVLDEEATKRADLQEAGIAHDEATFKSFAQRVIATAVAWVSSETVYNIFLSFATRDAHLHTLANLVAMDEFLVRLGYGLLCMIVCPLGLYILRPATGYTKGYGLTADFLKLVYGSLPMIHMWAIMNTFVAMLKWTGKTGWDALITALVLTILLGVLECMPCYQTASAGVAGGGDGDTITNRYLTWPAATVLATGRMWNEFMMWPIGELQSMVDGKPNVQFLVQMAYWLIITAIIIQLTASWSEKQAALQQEVGEADKLHIGHMEAHALDMERTAGQVFVGAFGFVYAWALNSTLNAFWFPLMCGCTKASPCKYPTYFAYAIVVTVTFTLATMSMQFQDRREPWGKAHQSLQILAMSLCTGWAWMGYFNAAIAAMDKEVDQGKVICFVGLFFIMWIVGGIWWHSFLKNQRRRQRQRRRDFKRTKVAMDEEGAGSSI